MAFNSDNIDWNSQENAKRWRKDLADTINATNEQKYQQLEMVQLSRGQKLMRLKELSGLYAMYESVQAV